MCAITGARGIGGKRLRLVVWAVVVLLIALAAGQAASAEKKDNPPCTEKGIASYLARRAIGPIKIDGLLDEASWHKAEKSSRFVDMVSGDPGWYDTRIATLWDDENLYVSFWIEQPYVEAKLTERDSLIFQEDDAEVFIDGGDAYYEFEINALGTVYQVFFIWRDAFTPGSLFDVPEFDIGKNQPLTFGGDYDR